MNLQNSKLSPVSTISSILQCARCSFVVSVYCKVPPHNKHHFWCEDKKILCFESLFGIYETVFADVFILLQWLSHLNPGLCAIVPLVCEMAPPSPRTFP